MEIRIMFAVIFVWIIATVLQGSSGAPQPTVLSDSYSNNDSKSSGKVSKHDSLLAWFNLFGDYSERPDMTSSAAVVPLSAAPGEAKMSAPTTQVPAGPPSSTSDLSRSPQSLLFQPQAPGLAQTNTKQEVQPQVYMHESFEGKMSAPTTEAPASPPTSTSDRSRSPQSLLFEPQAPSQAQTNAKEEVQPQVLMHEGFEGTEGTGGADQVQDPAMPPPVMMRPPIQVVQTPIRTPPPIPVRLPDPIDWSLLPTAVEYPGSLCLTSGDGRVGTCLPVNLPCGSNYEMESPEMCSLAMGTKCCVKVNETSQVQKVAEVFPGGKCKVSDGRVGDCRHRDLGCHGGIDNRTKAEAVCIRDLYDCCLTTQGVAQLEVVSRSLPSGCSITDGRTGVCVSVNFGCPSGTESPPAALCSIVMGLKCCVPLNPEQRGQEA